MTILLRITGVLSGSIAAVAAFLFAASAAALFNPVESLTYAQGVVPGNWHRTIQFPVLTAAFTAAGFILLLGVQHLSHRRGLGLSSTGRMLMVASGLAIVGGALCQLLATLFAAMELRHFTTATQPVDPVQFSASLQPLASAIKFSGVLLLIAAVALVAATFCWRTLVEDRPTKRQFLPMFLAMIGLSGFSISLFGVPVQAAVIERSLQAAYPRPLELAQAVQSSLFYQGVAAGMLLLAGGGITVLVAACRPAAIDRDPK